MTRTLFPDVYRGPEGRPGSVLRTLTVEGEIFAVRRRGSRGWGSEVERHRRLIERLDAHISKAHAG